VCSQACSSLPDEGIFPDHHVTESVLGAAYRSHTSVGSSRDRGLRSQNLLTGLQSASGASVKAASR